MSLHRTICPLGHGELRDPGTPCRECEKDTRITELEQERDALHAAIDQAQHDLEKCRYWAGTGWTWIGHNNIHVRHAWETLSAALEESVK
ncbi:MAG: hypothetical protein HY749_16000 [Gammaproteobacteria bacterium]|nr:hypothetical protein [Gammaproteobacteria bacterium]